MQKVTYKNITFNKPNRVENISSFYGIIHRDIKNGIIKKQPCEICENGKSVAHHEIYADNYSIRWLCYKHHKIIHTLFDKISYNNAIEEGVLMQSELSNSLKTKMQIDLPKDFNIKLSSMIFEFKKQGIKTSIAKEIVRLAQIGFNNETLKNEK